MQYIFLIIAFFISLFGLVFKTTIEDKLTGKKSLNNYGWIVLLLMILGLCINLFINYNSAEDNEKKSMQAKIDKLELQNQLELQLRHTKELLDSTTLNFRKSQDQSNTLSNNLQEQKRISNQAIILSKLLSEQLKQANNQLANAKEDLENLTDPIDSMNISFRMQLWPSKATIDSVLSLMKDTTANEYTDVLPLIRTRYQELYQSLGTHIISVKFYLDDDDDKFNLVAGLSYSEFQYELKIMKELLPRWNKNLDYIVYPFRLFCDAIKNEMTLEANEIPVTKMDIYKTKSFRKLCQKKVDVTVLRNPQKSKLQYGLSLRGIYLQPQKRRHNQAGIRLALLDTQLTHAPNIVCGWETKSENCRF